VARVYLVDDHVILRDALTALLEANEHSVVGQADNPSQAMAELRDLMPDVLLVDLDLGRRSGFELLADIQQVSLRLKVIVTTMSSRPRDVAEALRYGVDAYVLKGSTGAELLQAIDSVLKGQRFLSGEVTDLAVEGLTLKDDGAALASLSNRERQVIVLVVNGKSSAEIGLALDLSPKTVDSYRSRLMAKLGVPDVQGLVRFALRAGLIAANDP